MKCDAEVMEGVGVVLQEQGSTFSPVRGEAKEKL